MARQLLMGDEAVARGAIDAGLGAAYGYPGTPSTEIIEALMAWRGDSLPPYTAQWSSNEKVAYEQALGACMAGRSALVTMKHVGLNVAADPFMNSALLDLESGFVVAVADDPGMHSSQNEQDSRYYAEFASTICLEPADQQEAYDMTRSAFELSREFSLPVMIRLVTRVAHSRSPVVARSPAVTSSAPRGGVRAAASGGPGWTLLPVNARAQWRKRVESMPVIAATRVARQLNWIRPGDTASDLAIVTAGIGRNYAQEAMRETGSRPTHVHVGYYPFDPALFESIASTVGRVVVVEDGYPFVEQRIRALLPPGVSVEGRTTGLLPATGELTPESVRTALGLSPRSVMTPGIDLPVRLPRLCPSCPHIDSFDALREAVSTEAAGVITSDIGCYALGALPPYRVADSLVCMGASVGMAMGAAQAGVPRVVATIGDSTFLHSGMGALLDAAQIDAPMTLIILDNETVAMTGGQPTAVPSDRIEQIVLGLGVPPEHVITFKPTHAAVSANAALLEREIEHPGLSVVIARRSCIKTATQGRSER